MLHERDVVNNMLDNADRPHVLHQPLGAQEVIVETGSGGSAEQSTGGAQVNIISRDGGDKFTASLFAAGTNGRSAGRQPHGGPQAPGPDVGRTRPQDLRHQLVVGGPIVRSKLWFYTAHRAEWTPNYAIANLYYDAERRGLAVHTRSQPSGRAPEDLRVNGVRLTWAASPGRSCGSPTTGRTTTP